jgi:hypothetical protein
VLLGVLGCGLALALTGCGRPPALTKAELDAGVMSPKHPKIDAQLASNCRACHKEQPAIKK